MVSTKHQKTAASSSRPPGHAVFRAVPVPSVVAKRKTTSKKTVPKNERRNTKGWMDGLRAELVSPLIAAYVDALESSKAAGALKMKAIQHLYHTHFPWPMEDWEEPLRPLNNYDPLAPLPRPSDLTEERTVLWSAHMNRTNKRLERWIKWRIRKPTGTGVVSATRRSDPDDPIVLMVQKLCGVKKRIRARSGAQQYMHEAYSVSGMEAAVDAEFAQRSDQSVKKVPLALKQKIAKQFFASLPTEEQKSWVAKAKADADSQRSKTQTVEDGALPDDPAVIATCVRNTPSFLSKVSEGLDTVTGLKVFTMVAGPMGMYNGQVGYFDVATTKNNASTGMTFMEWLGPERSSDLVEAYMLYVESCVSDNDKARVIHPDATVPDWSKTHNAVNNVVNRTASFREMTVATGDEDSDESDDNEEENGDEREGEGEDEVANANVSNVRGSGVAGSACGARAEIVQDASTPPSGGAATTMPGDGVRGSRPRPRPAWKKASENEASGKEGGEEYPAELKRAALEALRRKRAHRQVLDDGEEDLADDDEGVARESKRQRTGLEEVTNLPELPGMDSGRFMTIAPAIVRECALRISSPSPPQTPSHLFSPSKDITHPSLRNATPANPGDYPSLVRDLSPAQEITPVGRVLERSLAREPTPALLTCESLLARLASEEAGPVEWLVDPLREFLAAEGAGDLLSLMESLWTLERQYVAIGVQPKKRATLTRGKNADGSERLKILGDWVAGGRTRKKRLVIEKAALPKFVKEWNAWWSSLQPVWRRKHRGLYVRDNVDGDFEMLSIAGANGMLSVVATLSWWRSSVAGKAMEQWLAAVEDVEWVMVRLIEATRSMDTEH